MAALADFVQTLAGSVQVLVCFVVAALADFVQTLAGSVQALVCFVVAALAGFVQTLAVSVQALAGLVTAFAGFVQTLAGFATAIADFVAQVPACSAPRLLASAAAAPTDCARVLWSSVLVLAHAARGLEAAAAAASARRALGVLLEGPGWPRPALAGCHSAAACPG